MGGAKQLREVYQHIAALIIPVKTVGIERQFRVGFADNAQGQIDARRLPGIAVVSAQQVVALRICRSGKHTKAPRDVAIRQRHKQLHFVAVGSRQNGDTIPAIRVSEQLWQRRIGDYRTVTEQRGAGVHAPRRLQRLHDEVHALAAQVLHHLAARQLCEGGFCICSRLACALQPLQHQFA